ncbi:hypothetical protein ACQKCU_20400 [Heyndrickxia sporothermodurans]
MSENNNEEVIEIEDLQEENKNEEFAENANIQEESTEHHVHPFDRMFFPNRHSLQGREKIEEKLPEQGSMDELFHNILNNPKLNNVNLDEIMNHVDNLFTSLNELKPLFNKFSPYLTKFLSKNK